MSGEHPTPPEARKPYESPRIAESYKIEQQPEFIGGFSDVHRLLREDGRVAEHVYKELHLDLLFNERDAAKLFGAQEREHETLRKYFPEDMVARSVYVVPEHLKGVFEEAKLDAAVPYTYGTTAKILANVYLSGRISKDSLAQRDEQSWVNRSLKAVGELIGKHKERTFVGADIQERINGISFADLFKLPGLKESAAYPQLRANVEKLISGLRKFHAEEPGGAFAWHGLASDNVRVETDDSGNPTGRVAIVDTNFSVRPDRAYQAMVVRKLEREVLQPLERAFELGR